jgi:hypothetical protein
MAVGKLNESFGIPKQLLAAKNVHMQVLVQVHPCTLKALPLLTFLQCQ